MQLLLAGGYLIGWVVACVNEDELLQFRREVLFLLWMLLAIYSAKG